MNLNMHITSQSFVQSYRRFERNSYVHTSSTSDTAGIGFPHHYSHSYFYRVSQQRAPQRIKIIRKSWSFLTGRIQLFFFSQMLGFSSDMARKSWMKSNAFVKPNRVRGTVDPFLDCIVAWPSLTCLQAPRPIFHVSSSRCGAQLVCTSVQNQTS